MLSNPTVRSDGRQSYLQWLLRALKTSLPDNDSVAGCDADCGQEEECDGDQGHVQLPVPRLGEVDPTLRPVIYEGMGIDVFNLGTVFYRI